MTTTLPKAKKVAANVEVAYRQSNRSSKWDPLMDDIRELEAGEKLEIPIPDGKEPDMFRNSVSNAVYNHIRRTEEFPDYRFPVKLSADLAKVYVVCLEIDAEAKEAPEGRPKAKRRTKRRKA